ncbi:MAG: winged helix-turn-helix domain-containing protein [Blautia sp.]|nr:winged helix-turn-helix domain-containing protein [Blautia sp.]
MIDWIVSCLGIGVKSFQIQNTKTENLKFRDLRIDFSCRKVIKNASELELTFIEFEILQLLAKSPGRIFSKMQIYDIVWKEPYSGDYNIVTSHISHIREKIEDDPANPIYIQTVWGVGYRFNNNLSSGQ